MNCIKGIDNYRSFFYKIVGFHKKPKKRQTQSSSLKKYVLYNDIDPLGYDNIQCIFYMALAMKFEHVIRWDHFKQNAKFKKYFKTLILYNMILVLFDVLMLLSLVIYIKN